MKILHPPTSYGCLTPSAETVTKSKDIMPVPKLHILCSIVFCIAYCIVMTLNEKEL